MRSAGYPAKVLPVTGRWPRVPPPVCWDAAPGLPPAYLLQIPSTSGERADRPSGNRRQEPSQLHKAGVPGSGTWAPPRLSTTKSKHLGREDRPPHSAIDDKSQARCTRPVCQGAIPGPPPAYLLQIPSTLGEKTAPIRQSTTKATLAPEGQVIDFPRPPVYQGAVPGPLPAYLRQIPSTSGERAAPHPQGRTALGAKGGKENGWLTMSPTGNVGVTP